MNQNAFQTEHLLSLSGWTQFSLPDYFPDLKPTIPILVQDGAINRGLLSQQQK